MAILGPHRRVRRLLVEVLLLSVSSMNEYKINGYIGGTEFLINHPESPPSRNAQFLRFLYRIEPGPGLSLVKL